MPSYFGCVGGGTISGMSDDLVAFLRARVDEDEQVAREATRGPWRVANVEYGAAIVNGPDVMQDGGRDWATGERLQVLRPLSVIPPDVDYGSVVELADAAHIARHDPARVLREVEAKRRTVEIHYDYRGVCPTCFSLRNQPAQREPYPCDTLMLLALPYADHPDYRDEWKP